MNTGLNYNVLLCVCAHVKMFGGFVVFQVFCITITFDCIQVATFREFGWVHLFLMNIGIELFYNVSFCGSGFDFVFQVFCVRCLR